MTTRGAGREEGALSPGFLLFIVSAAIGSLFLVQLAHASVLRTGAHTAAEAAALAGAEELRAQLLANPGFGPPVVLEPQLIAQASTYAGRNDAVLTGYHRAPGSCTVRTDVRGRTGVTSGPSSDLPAGRPESRAAAQVLLPPMHALGVGFSCSDGLSIIDPSLVPVPGWPGAGFDVPEPDPDDYDDPEDYEDAVEAWEAAKDAFDEAFDAWRDAVKGWAFGLLRNRSEVRLVPSS
jgi:hypothetical protein